MGIAQGAVAATTDEWLRQGGLVVAASDRAARALRAAFHRARIAEGRGAWPAPNILAWTSFVRAEWEARSLDARLVLNQTQEQWLWADMAARDPVPAAVLAGPRHRLAAMAMQAHELLATYAPRYLRGAARAGWQQDAAAFSRWMAGVDEACHEMNLVSESRLPLELIALLRNDAADRAPLMLHGFDRMLPSQREVMEAWGRWHPADAGSAAREVHFHGAADAESELAACARWCGMRLGSDPHARLLIVMQDASARRGELERALLQNAGSAGPPLFEFSLGVPLSRVPLAQAAYLLLRWLSAAIEEHELDWLLSTGRVAASREESTALEATMRALRQRGLERPTWTLRGFIAEGGRTGKLPPGWAERMRQAAWRAESLTSRPSSSVAWAALAPQLLASAAWPGSRALTSADYQAMRRWEQALDTCASLGFAGRDLRWSDFIPTLGRTLDELLFAPESRDAPIQIAGAAESAGLSADSIWFLGATEGAWPRHAAMHPLLPTEVQRANAMPHSTARLDWELARTMTARLLRSAAEVRFSYARQSADLENRPARLILDLAGAAGSTPSELLAGEARMPRTIAVDDMARIPFPADTARIGGGAGLLTAQSQCPFQGFAKGRLGADRWDRAEAGLNARQRGQLLHAVLHAVWAGPPHGLRTHRDLEALQDRRAFLAGHVERAIGELPPELRERLPGRYLELESRRLARLVDAWLSFESTRVPFTVIDTEIARAASIEGLLLQLRLDRIDRLNDETLLVIDYKTSNVSPGAWDLPRPEDVQLPLYATLDRDPGEGPLSGLVFARVRAGDLCFAGRVGDARGTLLAGLSQASSLVKRPLEAEQIVDWKNAIGQLAEDFLAGKADVDPRDPPKTCKRCGLHSLCRVGARDKDEDDSSDEGVDEECGDA